MGSQYLVGNHLMHPEAAPTTIVLGGGGRKYTTPVGTPILVPDHDAHVLEANGWFSMGLAGTTAQRPINPPPKTTYADTTLSAMIFYDGLVWRNQFTGAIV